MTGGWSRAVAAWARAGQLVDALGLSDHDVLTIMRVVEAASEEGTSQDRVMSYVDMLGFDLGGRSAREVVVEIASAVGIDLDAAVGA